MPRRSSPCTAPARPSSSLLCLSDGRAPHPRLLLGWPLHVPCSSRPPRTSTRCGGSQPNNDTKIISNWSATDLKLSYHGHVTLSSGALKGHMKVIILTNHRLGTGKSITFASLATPPTDFSRLVRRSASFTCSLLMSLCLLLTLVNWSLLYTNSD